MDAHTTPSHATPSDAEPSDAQLVARHAGGDPDAFGELVRRHRDRLWAVAVRTLGDREEAADALQDALVSAFRASAAGSFRGEAAVTTWLHRIVVNACTDRMRHRAARPTVPLPEHEAGLPNGPDQVAVRDTQIVVRAALRRLPPDQATAIVLVDLHGMSVDEAAAVLQVAPGTVKSRCSRGRARLLTLLSEPDAPTATSGLSVADDGNRGAAGHVRPGEGPPASSTAAGVHPDPPVDPPAPPAARSTP